MRYYMINENFDNMIQIKDYLDLVYVIEIPLEEIKDKEIREMENFFSLYEGGNFFLIKVDEKEKTKNPIAYWDFFKINFFELKENVFSLDVSFEESKKIFDSNKILTMFRIASYNN